MTRKIWIKIKHVIRPIYALAALTLFYIMRVFKIKKNKVVVTSFAGKVYGDNQKFLVEELHWLCPHLDIVWVKDRRYAYDLPGWLRTVNKHSIRWVYEYATAKVWLDNCMLPDYFAKRRHQLYVETWHGGLGIKKVQDDEIGELAKERKIFLLKNQSSLADVYISNSDHLSAIYRRAFKFRGPIWKCGYPKNDVLINGSPNYGELARIQLGIPAHRKVVLYAPTWRLRFRNNQNIDMSVYDIEVQRLKNVLSHKFGGEWTFVIRLHQEIKLYANDFLEADTEIVNATSYPEMQRLLAATDVMISDYSSCIFDGAIRRIPCFTYATDFDQYKNEERGVYYEMEELPFPYATNNDELEKNILSFDQEEYLKKWDAFCVRMGLNETGHSTHDIANKIADFLNDKQVEWPNDYE